MRKIKLGVNFKDEDFAMRFAESISESFEVSVIKEEERKKSKREESFYGMYDFIIADEENKGDVFIVWDKKCEDERHIFVFDGVKAIKKKIAYAYCLVKGDFRFKAIYADSNIICVCSPNGGCGTSSIAMSLCRCIKGKNIFISLDSIPYEDETCSNQAPVDLNKFMYDICDEKKNIFTDAVTYEDKSGVSHIRYGKGYNILNMLEEKEFERLVSTFTCGGFDNIIIDTGCTKSMISGSAISMADKVIVVENEPSVKSESFLEFIDEKNKDNYILLKNMDKGIQDILEGEIEVISYIESEKRRESFLDEQIMLFIKSHNIISHC